MNYQSVLQFLLGHHILSFTCIVGMFDCSLFRSFVSLVRRATAVLSSPNGVAFATGVRLASVVHIDSCLSFAALERFVQNWYHCGYFGAGVFFCRGFKVQCKFLGYGAPLTPTPAWMSFGNYTFRRIQLFHLSC